VGVQELVWVAIGVAVLAVSGALVPALLELRRAARSLHRALDGVGERLPSVLDRADVLLDEAARLTSDVRSGLDRVERAASGLREEVAAPLAWLAGALAGLREGTQALVGASSRNAS
jgi:uncharacterized protein YoxC